MAEREKYPSEAAERFQVRLPAGLRDRIRNAADINSRSMNAEIVATLESAYPAPNPIDRATQELGAALLWYQSSPRTQKEFDTLPRFVQLVVERMEAEERSEKEYREEEERQEFEQYQRDVAGDPSY